MANRGREINRKFVCPEGSESEESWRHELMSMICRSPKAVKLSGCCTLNAMHVKK